MKFFAAMVASATAIRVSSMVMTFDDSAWVAECPGPNENSMLVCSIGADCAYSDSACQCDAAQAACAAAGIEVGCMGFEEGCSFCNGTSPMGGFIPDSLWNEAC